VGGREKNREIREFSFRSILQPTTPVSCAVGIFKNPDTWIKITTRDSKEAAFVAAEVTQSLLLLLLVVGEEEEPAGGIRRRRGNAVSSY